MNESMFTEKLVFLDKTFKNSEQFFDFVFPTLLKENYVFSSFLAAIKKRESEFPTALPSKPYAIAFPHTDIEHINKPFIAFTRISGITPWNEMANNDNLLNVRFVFLLGFIDKNTHIDLLQAIMDNISRLSFINALENAKTEKKIVQILTSSVQF